MSVILPGESRMTEAGSSPHSSHSHRKVSLRHPSCFSLQKECFMCAPVIARNSAEYNMNLSQTFNAINVKNINVKIVGIIKFVKHAL